MNTPIVTIKDGQLKGKVCQDYLGGLYYSFLGIPYGKAPIGELRFKAPLPAEPWTGIKDATQEGPECPSLHMIFTYFIGSEDNCLNLNVYTPQLPTDDNDDFSLKPVMVWIHGGGFLHGSNRSELYSPDYLITEDIVLVCINYRLGVFGFLSLEDGSLEIPGNAGMKDMILALQWIQKNIKKFGGDPDNVTIFGESAGAASVHYLYLSPLSKGLFHKAIAQSGSALNCWAQGCSNGLIIAQNLGLEETDEKKILEYLKELPAKKIVQAQHKCLDPLEPCTVRPFGPVVEKNSSETPFLNEEPINIIKSGKFHHRPLIMGYTSREGMLFEAIKNLQLGNGIQMSANFEREICFDLSLPMGSEKSKSIAKKIQKFYYDDELPSDTNVDKLYLMRTDNMFLYGIHTSIVHQKLVASTPIYFYRFTLESDSNHFKAICTTKHVYVLMTLYFLMKFFGSGMIGNVLSALSKLIPKNTQNGTCHADDVGFLFKTFLNGKLAAGSVEESCVKRFVKLWTNFARTGNPTPEKTDPVLNVNWKPVTKETNFLLDIGSELKMEIDPDLERMEFWRNICE